MLKKLGVTLAASAATGTALAGAGASGTSTEQANSTSAAVNGAVPATSRTPCPTINLLLRNMKTERNPGLTLNEQGDITKVSLSALVEAGKTIGVNPGVMQNLGKFRLDDSKKNISVPGLLDPNKVPVHLASLARADHHLETVETKRLEELRTNPEYSTNGRVSHKELLKYQRYVWSLSKDARICDKFTSSAEVELLWDVLGGNKNQSISLQHLVSFLKDNTLPDGFETTKDPISLTQLLVRATTTYLSRI